MLQNCYLLIEEDILSRFIVNVYTHTHTHTYFLGMADKYDKIFTQFHRDEGYIYEIKQQVFRSHLDSFL